MDFDDIEHVAILVQLKNGEAHQVLSTPENKQIMLSLLAKMDDGLKLSKEIESVTFKIKI